MLSSEGTVAPGELSSDRRLDNRSKIMEQFASWNKAS